MQSFIKYSNDVSYLHHLLFFTDVINYDIIQSTKCILHQECRLDFSAWYARRNFNLLPVLITRELQDTVTVGEIGLDLFIS